jgi:sulfur carrier protein
MTITVNGQAHEIPDDTTVASLLALLALPTAGCAVARNDAVVPRSAHQTTILREGDRVEVIHAVAGG